MENNFNLDIRLFLEEEEALAKITEAVAKVYFRDVTTKKHNPEISKAYGMLRNLNPNYRLVLQGKPGFEKYNHLIPFYAEITSCPIYKNTNIQK